MVDRAVRTIKAYASILYAFIHQLLTSISELHFLVDMGLVSSNQITTLLSALPQESTPSIVIPINASQQPSAPINGMSNMSLNEKSDHSTSGFYAPPPQSSTPNPAASPPPYNPPAQQGQGQASALYSYNPTDAGDLALTAGDHITVLEHLNEEWWKGTNQRTGETGIFPRSYVQEEKVGMQTPAPQQPYMYGAPQPQQAQGASGFGSMPMAVANGPQGGAGSSIMQNGKAQEMVCWHESWSNGVCRLLMVGIGQEIWK
jgi:hypothetical protein